MTEESASLNQNKALRERLDLSFALQAAGLGVWELDPVTNVVIWDDRCRELFGLAKDNQLPYEQAIRHIHPDDVSRVDASVRRAKTAPLGGQYDETYRTIGIDDGLLRWVRFTGRSYVNEAGEVYRFAGVAQEVTDECRKDEALRESELRFRLMIDSLPQMIWMTDVQGRVEYLNRQWINYIGTPFGPTTAAQIAAESIHPDDAPSVQAAFGESLRTGRGFEVEQRNRSATGEYRWFLNRGEPYRDPLTGEITKWFGLGTDIHDRKLAEEALRTSEARFRSLVEEAPVATCLFVGCNLAIGIANGLMISFFGKGPSILGKPIREVLTADTDAERSAIALLEQVFATGEPVVATGAPAELTINGQSGIYYFDLSLKPLRKADGEVYAILETAVEVTEQVLARRNAEANHRRFRTLLEAIPQMTWTNTPQGEVDFYNERWYAYTGLNFEQTRDWGWQAVVHPDDLAQTVTTYRHALTTGEELVFENRYRRADGHYRWHLNWAMPLRDEDGEIVQWIGTATDIHERKQLEANLEQEVLTRTQQLQTSVLDLRRSNDNLQQFAYIASHDLQEPLRKIQSFGDLLKNQYADSLGEGVMYLERMQAAASRMSTLIRDLLAFSRISTQQDATAPVSLNEVIQGVLSDLDIRIQETGAAITVEPLPTVSGDVSQLGQLFQNLLSNALKFRQSGISPVVRVSFRRIRAGELPLSVRPTRAAAAYQRIDVSDNGIGFDEKYIDRIFQVFQRLHGKSEFSGTGIGLAICEKVAANHGGAITATSQPGQGATFSVYLPV